MQQLANERRKSEKKYISGRFQINFKSKIKFKLNLKYKLFIIEIEFKTNLFFQVLSLHWSSSATMLINTGNKNELKVTAMLQLQHPKFVTTPKQHHFNLFILEKFQIQLSTKTRLVW